MDTKLALSHSIKPYTFQWRSVYIRVTFNACTMTGSQKYEHNHRRQFLLNWIHSGCYWDGAILNPPPKKTKYTGKEHGRVMLVSNTQRCFLHAAAKEISDTGPLSCTPLHPKGFELTKMFTAQFYWLSTQRDRCYYLPSPACTGIPVSLHNIPGNPQALWVRQLQLECRLLGAENKTQKGGSPSANKLCQDWEIRKLPAPLPLASPEISCCWTF